MSFYFIVFILKMFFLFFFSMKYSSPEQQKLLLRLWISLKSKRFYDHGKFIGDILRLVNFNTALEEYKVRYPDGKSDCITKNCFFSVRVIHFLFLNFPGSNCSRFLFFTSFSLAVLIKFVLTKQKLILAKTVFKENFNISVFEGKFN